MDGLLGGLGYGQTIQVGLVQSGIRLVGLSGWLGYWVGWTIQLGLAHWIIKLAGLVLAGLLGWLCYWVG